MTMIKTRFAPSPTGYLHVGGLRTALYCYLFAKKEKGTFMLRVEDTDQERFVEGAMENLIKTLNWCGVVYDEGPILKDGKIVQLGSVGPYIQSERTALYKKYAEELLESGHAYHCFCTKERLETLRATQEKNKQATMYDRKCASIPLAEARSRAARGEPFVIRQKIPYETLKFKDLIRGNVMFDGKTIDDQVLVKSDGFPTYHLANVVDDHTMNVTHVIRGEEWLPSTPKHIFLYKAFGWQAPEFAHIPLLLNPDRTKLSKRQGHVSVEEYIQEGYLREAIINFVAFLGWHPGAGEENEILSLKELEEKFSIDRVHKAGAVFDIEKLDWFNWQWQKRLFNEEMAELAKSIETSVEILPTKKGEFSYTFKKPENKVKFQKAKAEKLFAICEKCVNDAYKKDQNALLKALTATEEKVLKEPKKINEYISFFFEFKPFDATLLTNEKMQVDLKVAKESLIQTLKVLKSIEGSNWNEEYLKEALMSLIEKLNVKTGQLLWPIRVSLTGQQFSPGAFEMLYALGKEESLKRIENTLSTIE